MLFIFGVRTIRIGTWFDTTHMCYPCRACDREVNFYRSYFHFCFIPVFPVGKKQIEMYCRNCHDETQLDSVMEEYAGKARTPFYFYSAIILFLAILACWVYWKSNNEKNTSSWIQQPYTGDVYAAVASST
jgi:hypothetical protein